MRRREKPRAKQLSDEEEEDEEISKSKSKSKSKKNSRVFDSESDDEAANEDLTLKIIEKALSRASNSVKSTAVDGDSGVTAGEAVVVHEVVSESEKKKKKVASADADDDEFIPLYASSEVLTKKRKRRNRRNRKNRSRKVEVEKAEVEKAEVEKAEVEKVEVEKVEVAAAICDRVQRMATYKPHACLKLRIEKYKNPQKLSVNQRIYERIYGIWWVVPEVQYMLKPKIPGGYRLKGEEGKRLKLHFMEGQNTTPANRTGAVEYDKYKAAYLMPFFRTEYPNLDCPKDYVNYIQRSFETHLSKQNDLHQIAALELMAACHDRFQMATLLLDMRHEAQSFADKNKCFFRVLPGSDKFEMEIEDLWTLTQELLGSTFYPRLLVKKRKNSISLYQIVLFVNESMEPVNNRVHYYGCKRQRVAF